MSEEICSCYKCNSIEKPLFRVKIDDKDGDIIDGWICMKHLFMQMLDAGMKEMHTNMADYTGILFNYKDEFKT